MAAAWLQARLPELDAEWAARVGQAQARGRVLRYVARLDRSTIILPEHCEEILTRECGPAEVAAEAAADVEDEGCCCATGERTTACKRCSPVGCVLITTAPCCSALPGGLPRALPAAAGPALVLRPQLHEQGNAQLP